MPVSQNAQNLYYYEICLRSASPSSEQWRRLLSKLSYQSGIFGQYRIFLTIRHSVVHYYLESSVLIPNDLQLTDFLLTPLERLPISRIDHYETAHGVFGLSVRRLHDFSELLQVLARKGLQLGYLECTFSHAQLTSSPIYYLIATKFGKTYFQSLKFSSAENLLAIDFSKTPTYSYKKIPKYLKIEKVLPLLSPSSERSVLSIDSFPYTAQKTHLPLDSYDFSKHSLVLGGSGSGKSKFLAALIDQIYQNYPTQYKIVLIDPHDALKAEFGNIVDRRMISFRDPAHSIDLFGIESKDINVSVELLLELFRSIMGKDYNSQLERVLRYASYLLIAAQDFSFVSLRQLLVDTEYRNHLVRQNQDRVPSSVSRFFLADFNSLRTESYAVAIAPLVALIDEIQMVPFFNTSATLPSLSDQIDRNFLTDFSLSRPHLGSKVTQMISGLLLQQLFLLAQRQTHPQKLLIIIDEVAVIESPLLPRLLSELRKYNAAIILAGQYFGQLGANLREAIFANTANYYIFRVSKSDAKLLAQNLDFQLASSTKDEDREKMLSTLKHRECLLQISHQDQILPGCKGMTLEFAPPLVIEEDDFEENSTFPLSPVIKSEEKTKFSFSIDNAISSNDINKTLSARRPEEKDAYARTGSSDASE